MLKQVRFTISASSDDEDSADNMVEMLVEELECLICYNTLKPPVSQCANGHGVCCNCRQRLNKCPVCKEPYLAIKVKLLDAVLRLLPRKCKYGGCDELMRHDGDHELWCSNQPTLCKLYSKERDTVCNWEGTGSNLVEHIKTYHEKTVILKERSLICFQKIINEDNLCNYYPMFVHGIFFWCNVAYKPAEQMLIVSFEYAPSGKLSGNINIYVSLRNSQGSYTAFKSVDADAVIDTLRKPISIIFHSSVVEEFVTSKDELNIQFIISKG